MYFITTKRMLEVCFSAHPNIQYRTTFFIILNTIAQKGTKPIGLIPSLQAVFQLLSFSSPFQIPFLSTYHPSVPRPYVHRYCHHAG